MDKNFTKILFFLLFILLASTRSFSQTISTGTIDPGPYGQGSTIAVPISVNDASGCIALGNTYTLYLSDASGNFSPGAVIGTYSGIYTPFINGLIPANAPAGTGYKVKVTASSPSASVSVASAPFTINAAPGVKPSVSSTQLIGANPEVFGTCDPIYDPANPTFNTVYPLTNNSAAGTTTTISIYDELNRTATNANISITNPGDKDTFKPTTFSNFTATVRTVSNGIIGTYDYQIVNNQSVTNFGAAGSSSVCLLGGTGILKYHINIPATSAGIELNYPGDVYVVNWGDGSSTTFTFCELKASDGFIQHEFKLPSCTATGNGVANSFYVQSQTMGQYCGAKTAPSGVSSKVLIVPTTSFTGPSVACVGSTVTLFNTSQPGPDPNSTKTTCDNNPGQLYDWYVDNVLVGPNYTLNQPFKLPVYTTPGPHHIVLHTQPISGACPATDFPMDICFENPPQPAFSITPRVCASATSAVIPANTSIIDPTCSAYSTHQYIWKVNGPAAVGYTGGTDANSQVPQFLFSTAGTYTVQLNINTSGCGEIPGPIQTVIVDALPVAKLSADAVFCGAPQSLKFNATTTSKTYTILSGSTTTTPTTYLWEVTGGAYQFVGGTNANSQYPQIKFTEDKTYTVKVTHTNSCSPPATDSQQITIQEAPVPVPGSYPPICSDGKVTLAGSVNGIYTGYTWVGAGTFSDKNSFTSTYTPTAAEISAGTATIGLQATSSLPAPCNSVLVNTTITINPVVRVNSPLAVGICSGTNIGYTITADHNPATFTWSASVSSGNPTGFTSAGSGNSINDVLINSTTGSANPVDETVTYHITPTYNNNGCPGPIADVAVTVHPLPTMSAAPATSPICTGKPANITFQSNIANTTYSWRTDPVTGVTGNVDQPTFISGTNGIQDVLVNSTLTTQTVTYHVTPRNGSCDGATIDVHVVVGPAIIADAGSDDEICGVTSYTLHGNTPVVGTGHWQIIQGPTDAFIETPDNPTTLVSNLRFDQTYKFEWTVTAPSGVCSNFSDVTIQVDALTDPGNTSTGDPTTVCAGSATGTGTITLGPHTGAILGWEYSTDGNNYYPLPANTTKFQTFGPLTAGTWWYRAIVKNGLHCDVLKSGATQITAIPQPTIPDAGPEERICNKTDYNLHGNTPISGIGTWTASLPGITFDNPNDPQTTAHHLVASNTPIVFTWSIQTAAPCSVPPSQVTIHDDLPAVAGTLASPITTVCAGDATQRTITLTGNQGNVVNWEYSINGTDYTPLSTPNTGVTQPFSNLTTSTLYRAIVKNGDACDVAVTDPILITVVDPPSVAVAGNPDHTCTGSYQLHGNTPAVGTGTWLPVAGISFDDPTDPTTTAHGLVAGPNGTDYTFTWQISTTSTCEPSSDQVTITADPPAVAGTLSSTATTVCTDDAATQTITLKDNVGQVVNWEYSTNGVDYAAVIPTNTSLTQTFSHLTTPTWFHAIVKNGDACSVVITDPIFIDVLQKPSESLPGHDDRLCAQDVYTLQGNTPAVGIGTWSAVPNVNFDDIHDPGTRATGLVAGTTYKFTWTINNKGPNGEEPCGYSSNFITVIDEVLPVATTSSDATVCSGSNSDDIKVVGQFAAVDHWEQYTESNPTWQVVRGYIGNSIPYRNLIETTKFRAIVVNGPKCGLTPSSVTTITVVPPPPNADAGQSREVCGSTTYTLEGNDPGTGNTGKWTLVSGPTTAQFDHDDDPHTKVGPLIPGNTYEFKWTITSPGSACTSLPGTVKITDDLPPVGGITEGDATICTGDSNTGSIKLKDWSGNIEWEVSTDQGGHWSSTGNPNSTTQTYSNLQTGEYWYHAKLTNGLICDPAFSTVTKIIVTPKPTTAIAGVSREVCGYTTYNLEGNDPGAGNTGKWTVVTPGTGITIIPDTDPHGVATGLIPGHTYEFQWSITATGSACGPSSDIVKITDDLKPVGGTTAGDNTVCTDVNSGSIQLLPGWSGSIDWEVSTDQGAHWSSTGNPNSTTQTYNNLTTGEYWYHAKLTNGLICDPAFSTVTKIIVTPKPTAAIAGTSREVCGYTSYTLEGNDPGAGNTGKWTLVSGPTDAQFDHDDNPHATVGPLTPGQTYEFKWSITATGSACGPSSDIVKIINDLKPVGSTTVGDATVCNGINSGSVQLLTGWSGSINWEMSTNQGLSWSSTNNPGSTIQTYTNLTTETWYRAKLTGSSFCDPAYSTITKITVGQPAAPSSAGTDQSVCNVTTYTLQGSDPGTGTGIWTLAPGSDPAHIDMPGDPHTTVSGLVAGGIYSFTWTTYGANPDGTVSICNPNPSTVKITNDKLPVGGTTVGAQTVCAGINSGSVTLKDWYGTIQWVKSTDNGVTWVSTNNPGSTIQYYSNLTVPTQYMAILSNGSCGIANSTVTTINVGPAPIPSDPGKDDEVCSLTTYPLKAVLPAGATGMWTIESGAGARFDDLTNPTTTVRNLIPGNTYKFTWTVSGTSPCAPIPGTVTIKDDLPADGGVATPVPAVICAGSSTVVTLGGQSGHILRWESSTDGTNWQPIYVTGQQQTFSNLTVPTQFRAISIGQGICGEVPSASAIVTVNPTTVVSNPGKDDEVCNVKTYPLKGNSPLPNTGFWTITGGPAGATLDDPTDPKTTARGLVAGNTYQFTWTITGTAPCPPSVNAVNIKVDLQALGGTTNGAATVCAGANDGFIYLKDSFGSIIKWVSSTNNGASWTDLPNTAGATSYHYSGLMVPTQFKALLHEDGICGDDYSTATTITVNPQTVIANAGQNFNICNTNIAKLNGNNLAPFNGIWTQTAGPVVHIDNPASYQTVVSGLAKGNVYTFEWKIIGLPPCGDSRSTVTIGAYEDVTPSFTQSQSQSCGPVNVTFTNTSTPSPVGTFEWDFGDGTPIYTGVNPPTHSFAASSNGNEITYTVRLTPVSNCGVQTPYVGTVKVSPAKPIASLLPGQISYCGTFSLTAKNMSPGNNAQYDFYMKDAKGGIVQHVRMNDTSTAVFQPITPTASTYYSVYVVATDFCGNQGTSSVINVAVAPSSLVSGIQIKGGLENICLGSPITFQNISTGGDRFTITVYDNAQKAILRMPSGTGEQNYTPTAIGTYYVSITAGNTGCGDAPASALTPFNVYPAPDPAFNYTVDNNYNVSFFNNTPDITGIPAPSLNYVWNFGDGSEKEGAYTPKAHHFDASRSPFTVTLTATTPGTECFNVATKTIDIKFHGDLYVPNAFIPASQNKELNTYRVKGTGMRTWHMQIFNNFGQLIWESTKLDANGSPTEGWDGTYKGQIVEQGVYIWQISATLLNGEEWKGMSYNGSTPSKTGPIHLIR
ncbi:PKD-like domain-containing protein [Mucilaginibacter jinjuensis]|uniref:Gliding motility-associated C-terminal domain-containing protein n=1 Tax=Mucilaginibacter jinjuensis TaxID=1176721 RepID=A0ABY7TBY6_9SPHI|nr:PKD-like domain-containing protein [Mucilaginibacter jinjuensis]WCT13877.1 gliding motility-associated C-terminal domain-containing protein [Mucilaginibacter jinjuensis]